MPDEPSLRALFTAGPAARLSAEDIFTNRVSEIEAFNTALDAFASRSQDDNTRSVTDPSMPRRNVLSFYGIGGIGKTALSRHLEAYLLSRKKWEEKIRVTSVRVDFDDGTLMDPELFLLRVRSGLGQLGSRWHAFDLALASYWERAHPGEPLREFLDSSSVLRRGAGYIGLSQQIENTLGEALKDVTMASSLVNAGSRAGRLVYGKIAEAIRRHRLLDDCPFFAPLVEADADGDIFAYYSSLLAWDLCRTQRTKATIAVIFLDTFERVSGLVARDMERSIQRCVFLLPNVLFVVTGRNYLDWAEIETPSELDYTGRARWPLLDLQNNNSEPRQHLMGFLSPDDCDTYLRGVLIRDRRSVIGREIRQKIVAASGGLPLYLDISVAHFLELHATGRAPDLRYFGGPLAAVVSRLVRDMPPEERTVLRAVSLLDSFDEDLARAAAGQVSGANIRRFISRPFVEQSAGLAWPYSMHSRLRELIRTSDRDMRDAWSEWEWHGAAERIFDHLGSISGDARASRDSGKVGACFVQGMRLVTEFGLAPGWLIDVAAMLVDLGLWRTLASVLPSESQTNPAVSALISGFRGISLRRAGDLDASLACFDEALSSEALPVEAAELFTVHRAHSLRNAGRYDDAEIVYRRLAAQPGRFRSEAQNQISGIFIVHGDFPAALEAVNPLPSEPDMMGEALRMVGHVYRMNGQLEQAENVYRRVLEQGISFGSPAMEGKALTNLAETLCWLRPMEGHRYALQAIDYNKLAGNQLEVLKAYAALAIAERGAGALERAANAVDENLRMAESTHYRAGATFGLIASLFQQLIGNEADEALNTATALQQLTAGLGVYQFLLEIATWWLESRSVSFRSTVSYRANWLAGAREAWLAILSERLGSI